MTPEPCPCGQTHSPSPASRVMYDLGTKIQTTRSIAQLGPLIIAALNEVERETRREERDRIVLLLKTMTRNPLGYEPLSKNEVQLLHACAIEISAPRRGTEPGNCGRATE